MIKERSRKENQGYTQFIAFGFETMHIVQMSSFILAESKQFKMFEHKPNVFYHYCLQSKGCLEPT